MAETAATTTESAIDLVCPECGYDLRGITSEQCPECGQRIDRAGMSLARIPWSHRNAIGRVRAYWRTNLLVIFRPRRLVEEMVRPVGFADAQRFRHVTVLIAWLPLFVVFVVTLVINWSDATTGIHIPTARFGWFLEAACFFSLLPAAWLALLMISGVGSYFFHPTSMSVLQQNRAIALSYYTCAPLAWLWLPAAFSGIAIAISSTDWGQWNFGQKLWVAAICCAVGFFVAIIAIGWSRTTVLMRRTTHCGPGRSIAMDTCLPVAWILSAVLAMGIPLVLFYISLVIVSFR
jgi:predicted RNA-binding Zn-ribbon protein involved in translation (DUF1610 family)